MPSSTFTLTSLGAALTLHVEGTAPPEVEISYDGCAPPLELLGHLRALGFVGLVPQPPPSTAIDWTRPDHDGAVTGFTLRPYAAMSRGRLDVARDLRTRALDATRYLLERMAAASAPAPAGPPSSTPDDDTSHPAPGDIAAMSQPGPSSPAPLSPPGTLGDAGRQLIEVTVAAEHAAAARPVLAAIGELVGEAPTSWTTTAVYRGQRMETRHLGTGLVVEIAAADRADLLSALGAVPVHSVRELSAAAE
ncbi:hypothetical protein [Rhabdothermincola salaria]|uniref:hypothetical protein n=1 Tax=Rhabdothermincola salaria TaxID=2903142 RepID=UPI001E533091|nr:hypothetical protein [Rhabdothermincola salaria]MCD9622928.1 hypothetical protein [Rhabdothermincola salaria]